jgi:hypothetical protein
VLDELIPQAWHHVEWYANNPIEADHSRLKKVETDARTTNGQDSAGGHR